MKPLALANPSLINCLSLSSHSVWGGFLAFCWFCGFVVLPQFGVEEVGVQAVGLQCVRNNAESDC
eukprot:61629-Amorphochlora_amoeboformis.AAC.2